MSVTLMLLCIEQLNVYEVKIKTTLPALTPGIFKVISEQFEYYNLEEILEKISDTNGYNERYLGILNDVAVNGEKVDYRVVIYILKQWEDPDIRANVSWYIYSNFHYWLPCIDFILKTFQKENVERVNISISGALEMIIRGFFISQQLNLSGIAERITKIIYTVRKPIDQVIDFIKNKVKKIADKLQVNDLFLSATFFYTR